MWNKISQRLTDPLFYQKHWRNLLRPLKPARAPLDLSLDELLAGDAPVLAVIAHPDDELFASALLVELAGRGIPFHLVCLTRGEGGCTGDVATREELGKRREAELKASAAALGARSVEFLGHVDPLGKTHRTYAPPVGVGPLARQIEDVLDRHQPAAIITHGSGGEYWHPAHLLVHRAVFRAAKRWSRGKLHVLTIHAWQPGHPLPGLLNRDDPADLMIDGTAGRERRLAAFRAHRSQHDYFANHGGGSLEGYVDRTAREAFRYYPFCIYLSAFTEHFPA